jgi:hypothetical protein
MLFLNRGLVPLGTVIAGIGTQLVGVQITSAVMAGGLLCLGLLIGYLVPEVRDLE